MAGEPGRLEFRVLGDFEVARAGEPLALGSPQQQAVLLALLLEPGRAVSTGRISQLLWGDDAPPGAVSTVHSYISRLRRVLQGEDLLDTTSAGYRLRIERTQVDAFVFEDLATQGRRALTADELVQADRSFSRALSLWRGPCLPEFADEPVAQSAIDRLEGLRLLTVEDATDVALTLGRHLESIGTLEQAVADHPLRERLWAQLALALYRSGRQADALAALRRVRRILADELGVDPGPALRRLEEQVLTQDRSLDPPGTRPEPSSATLGPPGVTVPREYQPTRFVGRRRELDTTRSLLAAAVAGHGGSVVIVGEPGIGKSTLARETAAVAGDLGVLVLWARCPEPPAAPALWTWLQLLRSVREQVGIPVDASPQLLDLLADQVTAMTSTGPAPDRFALGQAVVELFARVTEDRPVLLVIDDAHWADEPSLDLLRALAPALPGHRMLLVLTHREGAEAEPLTRTLAVLARATNATTLRLRGLDEDAVHQLLGGGGGDLPALARALRARTEGNPFFLGELIRAAETEGHVLGTAPVPPGVRDVLRARLLDLPRETFELLAAAAVLGRECDLADLADVAGLTSAECADRLEPAIAARIMLSAGAGLSALRFAHALVQETVLGDLSPVRVARLHAQSALVLARRHRTTADAAEPIAQHVLAGAGLVPAETAVPALTRAADVALSRAAHETGDRLLEAAQDLVTRQPTPPEADPIELAIVLRRIRLRLRMRGFGVSDLADLAGRARELSGRSGESVTVLAEALAAAAVSTLSAGDRATAVAVVEHGLDVAGDSAEPSARHAAHQAAARVAFNTGRIAVARTELAECLSVIRAAEAAGATGWFQTVSQTATPVYFTLGLAAFTEWIAGDADAADRQIEACLRRTDLLEEPVARQLVSYLAGWIAAWSGRFERSLSLARDSLADQPDTQAPYFRQAAQVLVAWSTACLGNPAAARRDVDEPVALMLETAAVPWVAYSIALRAEILMLAGDVDASRGVMDQAMRRVSSPIEEPYIAEILRIRARVLAADPDGRDAARDVLREGMRLARSQGADGFARRLQHALAELPPAPHQ